MNAPIVNYVEGRSCDGCTMCCKLLRIESLDKPRLQWCSHCDIGAGCKIYQERPRECRDFDCGYLIDANIGAHWKPANTKMVISLSPEFNRLVVYVDPDRPDAWRKQPFYSDIKSWARTAVRNRGQVLVSQGRDTIAVMPDSETNLGPVRDDQLIITRRRRGAGGGTQMQHLIVDKDDPVLDAMRVLKDGEVAKTASPDELAQAQRVVDAWLAQHN